MRPHSPHLPPFTGQSVSRLPNDLSAWRASSATYATYPHSWMPNTGVRALFGSPIRPLAVQNAPLPTQKKAFLPYLSLQTGFNGAFLSRITHLSTFTYGIYSHLLSLTPQPVTPTYTLTPPLKGVSVSGGEGGNR
jgi:hypothetical protein